MSQITVTVPQLTLSDKIAIILVVAAILASIIVEVYSRHYTKKQINKFGEDAVKLSKVWVAVLLNFLGALFTGLGYLLTLAPSYTSFGTTLPFVGKHWLAVVGIATSLYMLKNKVWFQKAADKLSKFSGTKNPLTQSAPVTQPNPAQAPEASGADLLG